jgi:hypothetical protein
MDNWQMDLLEIVEAVTEIVEQYLQEVGQAIGAIAEQVEIEIIAEIEYFVEEFWEPTGEAGTRNLEEGDPFPDLFSDADPFFNPKVEATPETHPACVGCCHYHGRIYSGNLLVCAMHPYGWDDANCPDWEAP